MNKTPAQPQARQNPITGEWVIIARNRAQKPTSFIKNNLARKEAKENQKESLQSKENCPFCQILKRETPLLVQSEGQELPISNADNWTIAVVPNKYPAFVPAKKLNKKNAGLYQTMTAIGHHELVITKNHHQTIDQMPISRIEEVFSVYQKRYLYLAKQPHIKYVSIFHNQGPKAGASISHPHSQIIAISVTDADINKNLKGSKKFWQKNNSCLHCQIIADNKKNPRRVIWENNSFIVFSPFAPKSAFTLQIYPKKHQAHFEKINQTEVKQLAEAFKIALKAIKKGLNNPDYNFFLHTAPCDKKNYNYYHWHWQIMPKTQIWAGFELGAGIEICTISPEDSAKYLRKQIK
jgi:UDPglucose--hexose-1-phosphate uridylyltransferase